MSSINIAFVASEVDPFIKTGGLGDVAGSLPRALHALGHDIRIILPAYGDIINKFPLHQSRQIECDHFSFLVLEGNLPGTQIPVWLIHLPGLLDRPGHPYLSEHNAPWPDNALRFGRFCQAVVSWLNTLKSTSTWAADVVHCNDWQTGLIPALYRMEASRPAQVFTIHNLAYQGVFDISTFDELAIPGQFRSFDALEYHGQMSFIKGGLVYADRINTVSPSYAREIQTSEFGFGLDGLLQYRAPRLSGILNGIDVLNWNPATDPVLSSHFTSKDISGKQENKLALQKAFGLPSERDVALLSNISRLVWQKGIDLITEIIPTLMEEGCQMVFLGTGDTAYESALQRLAQKYPRQLAVKIGFDESLAHLIEAGSDIFLMPSRFEPCGLNQMYSQRYGTIPIVNPVGGLKDSVIPFGPSSSGANSTGFFMNEVTATGLLQAVRMSLNCFKDKPRWRHLQQNGMSMDFSWQGRAQEYVTLYIKAGQDIA